MKVEVEQMPETGSICNHLTRPELFDHDYWSGSSVPTKTNGYINSAFSERETTELVTNGSIEVLQNGNRYSEAPHLGNAVLIQQGSESVILSTKYHCDEDPAFHRFFVCHYCDNTWSDMSQLVLHLESAHPSELEVDAESHTVYNLGLSQVHSCPYCDLTTDTFELLVDHIGSCNRATGDHCCPHCGYRSMLKASLKDHMFQKHRDTCLYCILNIQHT